MYHFLMTTGLYFITLPPPPDFNGHDYVDLGLPSGTLWATMNVGASKPSDYGQYFQWGDTIGYTADQVGTGEGLHKFSSDWSDYKWYLSTHEEWDEEQESFVDIIEFRKYATPGVTLDLEDDAAHVNMGGDWHMPTPEQCQELISNTTFEEERLDDKTLIKCTSKKDDSKFIFFSQPGCVEDSAIPVGRNCWIWSTMLLNNYRAYNLIIKDSYAYLSDSSRSLGLPVRGVIGQIK